MEEQEKDDFFKYSPCQIMNCSHSFCDTCSYKDFFDKTKKQNSTK